MIFYTIVRYRAILGLVFLFGCVFSLIGCNSEEKGNLSFVNVKGQEITPSGSYEMSEAVIIRMDGLKPHQFYRVRVWNALGERIYGEDLVFISNGQGELPDTAVAFLNSEERSMVTAKLSDDEAGSIYVPAAVSKTVSPGRWCVNVYRFNGGTVTGQVCRNVKDSSKRIFSVDKDGKNASSFLLNGGDVYVKGENFSPGSNVDLYVLSNTGGLLSDGDELLDNRGLDPLSLTVDSSGKISGLVWADPSKVGFYDIVADVNGNGLWDEDTDVISSLGFVPSFAVQDRGLSSRQNRVQMACSTYGGSYCTFKDFFIDEDVYIVLNPLTYPTLSLDNPTHKLYIVDHKDDWTPPAEGESNNKNALKDATGEKYRIRFPSQTGSQASGRILAIPSGLLKPGCYDLVVDVNGNEIFDYGADFIDYTDLGGSPFCGFSVPGDRPGEEGLSPKVAITLRRDGDGATVADGGETASSSLLLQATVSSSSDTVKAVYLAVESSGDYRQLSYSPDDPDAGITHIDTGLFPLYTGENRITAFAVDSNKRVGYARTTVVSNNETSARALEIELRWAKPEGATNSDLDLHLVNAGGAYFGGFDINGQPQDCYYWTCTPGYVIDWGVQSDSIDDPLLEIDCISDCVRVEKTFMSEIGAPGEYHVYVDAFNGSGIPFVNIYADGFLILSDHTPACETLVSGTASDSWHVGYFTVSQSGGINTVDSFTPLTDCDTAENFQ